MDGSKGEPGTPGIRGPHGLQVSRNLLKKRVTYDPNLFVRVCESVFIFQILFIDSRFHKFTSLYFEILDLI